MLIVSHLQYPLPASRCCYLLEPFCIRHCSTVSNTTPSSSCSGSCIRRQHSVHYYAAIDVDSGRRRQRPTGTCAAAFPTRPGPASPGRRRVPRPPPRFSTCLQGHLRRPPPGVCGTAVVVVTTRTNRASVIANCA